MRNRITNEVNQVLNTSAEKLWNNIKVGSDVDQWFPLITTCELQGEGIGGKRICTTSDGSLLEETITNIDEENRIFQYNIESHTMQIPTTDVKGLMMVTDVDGKANLVWKVSFELTEDLDETTINTLKGGMIDSMKEGFKGLEMISK